MALTQAEIDQRADLLRRFRAALLKQRERFGSYLRQLETQPPSAATDMEIEKAIVRDIAGFERSIAPLEMMYQKHDPAGAAEIPKLREALQRTREHVVRRSEHSRDAVKRELRQEIESLRGEISGLRIMRKQRSVYATPEPVAVDISA